jgi:hypothetical protein
MSTVGRPGWCLPSGVLPLALLQVVLFSVSPALADNGDQVTTIPSGTIPFAIDQPALHADGSLSVIIHATSFQQFWVLPFGNQPDAVQNMIINGNPNSVSVGDLLDVASPKNPNYWLSVINGVNERIRRSQANPTYAAQDASNATADNPRVGISILVNPANGNANHTDTTQVQVAGFAPMYLIGIRQERTTDGGKQYFLDAQRANLALLFPVDSSPPTTTAACSPMPNAAGWSSSNLEVTFTALDEQGGSGVKSITLSASGAQPIPSTVVSGAFATASISAEGETTISYAAADNAGNIEPVKTLRVKIDKTAPTISGSSNPLPNANGWINSPVTVSFTFSDTLSGVASSPSPRTLAGDGIDQSVIGTVVDQAGNSTTATVGGINIDLTPPTLTFGALNPAPNAAGWNSTSVSIPFSASDGLSGVAATSITSPIVLTAEGVAVGSSVMVTDRAGNSTTFTSPAARIDTTAPTVAYSGNSGTYTVDQTVNIVCTATDSLSGVAASTGKDISGPAYSFNLGANAFSATATDRAGNVGSGGTSFTVQVTFDSLANLTKRFITNVKIADSLCSELMAAKTAAARGNTQAKKRALTNYENDVKKQQGKTLTLAQAALLVKLAGVL